jgi:16S rRNA (cytosine967-C5)-methyltransferase
MAHAQAERPGVRRPPSSGSPDAVERRVASNGHVLADSETVTPARRVAFAVLRRVAEHGAYADRALHGEARDLVGRERAFARQLTFGTVQRLATLDHVIAALARPVERLDGSVVAALRLGLYQLMFLDAVPDHAAVTESVELAKAADGRGGHRLVNAVLRRAARERPVLPGDATPETAAIHHSSPRWLVDQWWEQFGPQEARAMLAACNRPAELALRTNTLVTDRESLALALPVATRPAGDPPEGLVVDGPFDAHAHPLFALGAFQPQSRASMRVAPALDPQPGERVLDLCAAPGGKTTHLAARMADRGEVVAVERHKGRANSLVRSLQRMQAGCVRVELGDAAARRPAGERYDRVLVDPPCSGLGTLQGHPDLRWRMTPGRIEELAGLQVRILRAGLEALRPGGTLVYSTCTLTTRENEDVLAEAGLAGVAVRRTFPHRDGTEGFAVAVVTP